MKVVLELQDQPSNVRRVTVRHDIVIGRGADCNLRLSAPQISRRHCFLRVGRDGVSVTDLDSSNGTFVDGERLKSGVRQPLQNGSQLSLGPIRFLIQVRDDAASSESKKSSASKEQKAVAKGKSEPSTIVADVDATMRNAQAMNLAVEQAGATADSREVTSDFVAGQSGASPADAAKKRAAQLPKFDSRAEIVDLGRQLIAAEEEAKNQTFNAPSKPAASQKTPTVPPAAPPAKAASKDVAPPVPPAEDVDAAPADMSFFDDFAAEKTVTPLDDKYDAYDAVEEVFDVAEVVEELPDENIEVVEDEEEVIEVAEVVEEVEEAIEVVDEDDSSPVRGSSAVGNVMSLDDDWEDPDAPARRHRPVASSSTAPQKMSQAARATGSAPASSPKPAPSSQKSTGPAKPVSAGLKNAAPVAAAALPLAIPELVEEAELVEVVEEVEDVEEVVEVAEFDELVEPIEDAVVAVEDEVVEVFDDEVAAVVEDDVVEVIEEVQEVEPVEDVLDAADLEPIASLETDPVDEVEAAEIVEVSDFFDAAEPEAEVAEVWDEPEVVAADPVMEFPAATELQNEPWSEMAQEELAIEDAPIDADELMPVVEVDAVSEMTEVPEIANFAEVADMTEFAASEVSEDPVFGVDAAEQAEADAISTDEPEFNPDWLSADDEPVAQSSSPSADENITGEDVADWLTAEPEVESAEFVDVIDAAEVSQPELLSENNDVEPMSEDEIVAVEEVLDGDVTELPQLTEAPELYAADVAVENVTASVNDDVDAGDDVMSWLSGDSEELVDPADVGVSGEPDTDGNLSAKDGDDIDPNLRDFLKGF